MTTVGVVGQPWRASVTAWGAVDPWDRSRTLDWWVAADDRWHTPRDEPTVRQHHVRGAPVVETVIRVPGGDAIHRVYAVPDHDGLTVVEVENASSLPFAVALGRNDLLTTRPPSDLPIQGIELPAGTVVLPVAHRSTLRVALPHHPGGPGPLPAGLPDPDAVARGWATQTERGMVLEQPDGVLADELVSARAELLLTGPGDPTDAVAFALAAGELVRLGEHPDAWVRRIATGVQHVARSERASERGAPWDVVAALDATVDVLRAAGEHRGAADAGALAARFRPGRPMPAARPHDAARLVAWSTRRMVLPTTAGAELLAGFGPEWLGSSLSAFRVPVRGVPVSFAVRWHGERPALLWECGEPMTLCCPAIDPSWSTDEAKGEALLAAPARADDGVPVVPRDAVRSTHGAGPDRARRTMKGFDHG